MSISGNFYALVIADDYSRFTWTLFLAAKMIHFMLLRSLPRFWKMKRVLKLFL